MSIASSFDNIGGDDRMPFGDPVETFFISGALFCSAPASGDKLDLAAALRSSCCVSITSSLSVVLSCTS